MSRAPELPSPTHREAFGHRLRDLRLAAGLSQEALAEKSGLHRTYVSSVERGHRNVGLDNIYALAEALGLPAARLFGEHN
ncbi:helix-turn-helix domain-containing protein [Microbacterium sp. bgisy189]|uniref:helix-turn-helix domain-containing protein n=1 Tax=Microbacterium sp. bgisy189 TaxID=3413798 RepID=UPI003EBBF928